VLIAVALAAVTLARPASAETTIKSQDGTVQLTVPNGWRESTPVDSTIQLQAVSSRGAAVLIHSVSKEDFKDLKSFANVMLERLKKRMPDAEQKMEDVELNNTPAVRVSVEGTLENGQRRGYIITFFESGGNYVEVTALASLSVFKSEQSTLAGLAGQVKILAPSAPASAPAAQSAAPGATAKPPATRSPSR
jgi:hypothetical protein